MVVEPIGSFQWSNNKQQTHYFQYALNTDVQQVCCATHCFQYAQQACEKQIKRNKMAAKYIIYIFYYRIYDICFLSCSNSNSK